MGPNANFWNAPQEQERFSFGQVLLLLLALGTAVAVSLAPYINVPMTENEGIFSAVALQMKLGLKLYTEVWDHKPPLIFVHYRIIDALWGSGQVGQHLYAILAHLVTAALTGILAVKLGLDKRGVVLTSFFYAALLASPVLQAWTPQADLLMQPFLVLSFFVVGSKAKIAWFLSGFCWGIAFFTKQSALFYLGAYWPLFSNDKIFCITYFLFGVDLIAVIVGGPFVLSGRMGDFWGAVSGVNESIYVVSGWGNLLRPEVFLNAVSWMGHAWQAYGIPLAVTALSLGASFSLGFKKGWNGRRNELILLCWFLSALLSCAASGYFFGYYFVVLIPPVALILGQVVTRNIFKRPVLCSGLCLLALGALAIDWETARHQGGDALLKQQYGSDAFSLAAHAGMNLKTLAKPEDELLCWVRQPQIYSYSGLKMAAMRTLFIPHLLWFPGEEEKIKERFLARKPKFIFLASRPDRCPAPPAWLLGEVGTFYESIANYDGENPLTLYRLKAVHPTIG